MAPTGYSVASAVTLLGAKPPQRREIEDVYFERMAAADRANRERSGMQRTREARRKHDGKKVSFTPSTASLGAAPTSSTGRARVSMVEDTGADSIHRGDGVETHGDIAGVAAECDARALLSNGACGDENDDDDSSQDCKPGPSRTRQDWGGRAVTAPPGSARRADQEGRASTQRATSPALPLAHSHRANANSHGPLPVGVSRIDTSGARHDDASIGAGNCYTASTSAPAPASSTRPPLSHPPPRSENVAGTAIYFTPVDVNQSPIDFEFFHAPMSTPRIAGSDETLERGRSGSAPHSPLLSKGKAYPDRYPHAPPPSHHGRSRRRSSLAKSRKEKITLAPEQLDRLVVALANAPLVRTHLRKQWLDDEHGGQPDKPSLLSLRSALRATDLTDSTPSLTNISTASETVSESSSTLYSRPNTPFVGRAASPSPSDDNVDDDADFDFNEHPLARNRPRVKFGGIALCDPKVHGAPIRFVSKGYKKGANVLQVGQCSFLNVPYGASVDCILRVEPGDIAHGGAACSVTVQVMAQVLERRKGRKIYLLVTEIDVTESLTKAVLVELARHTGYSLDDIELVRPQPVRHDSPVDSIDWCALADELHATCSTNEIIENAASSFKTLDAQTCTMQTLTLLSELERIKANHVDFLVLRSTARSHSNGMPQGITVPWISQHLDRHVHLWSPEACSLFREDLVAAVGRRHADGEPFAIRVFWGRKKKIVRCVPLLEGDGSKTAGWVAFVGDEFDV